MNKLILLSFMVLAVSAWSIPADPGVVPDPVPEKAEISLAVPLDCIPQAGQMSTVLPSDQAVADAVLPTVETLFAPTPCSDFLGECFEEGELNPGTCWQMWCVCVWLEYGDDEC